MPPRREFADSIGSFWANCPVVVGIVEALAFCGQRLEDLHVLSIGSTNYPFRIDESIQLGGLLKWNRKVVEAFMFGQAQGAVAQAKCLLGDRFHRIEYLTATRSYAMDATKAVGELIRLGRDEGEKIAHRQVAREQFLNGIPATPSTFAI